MAQRLIEKKTHNVFGNEVNVLSTPPPQNTKESAVLVKGLTKNVTQDMLESLFQSRKYSGGGKVVKMKVDWEKGCAIIWFHHSSGLYILWSSKRIKNICAHNN